MDFLKFNAPVPGKWDHVPDTQKEAFLTGLGHKVVGQGGVWYLMRADGWSVTLGNPRTRTDAIWIAYDLIQDPPPTAAEIRAREEEERKKLAWKRQKTWIAKKF